MSHSHTHTHTHCAYTHMHMTHICHTHIYHTHTHLHIHTSCNELYIHGLGAAIHRAVNLALQLQETSSHSLQVSTTTSTVELVDDMEPVDDVSARQTLLGAKRCLVFQILILHLNDVG